MAISGSSCHHALTSYVMDVYADNFCHDLETCEVPDRKAGLKTSLSFV